MDLRRFRTKTLRGKEGELLTQAMFGDALGVTQEQVSRWEKNPDSISVKVIHLICDTFGISPDILFDDFQAKTIDPLDFGDPLDEFYRKQEMLEFYTSNSLKVLKGYEKNSPDANHTVRSLAMLKEMKHLKPIVGILGRYDAGKSHLVNSICGANVLPTGWSPTTVIPVLLRHTNARPDWLKSNVLILNPKTNTQLMKFRSFYPRTKSEIDHILVDSGNYDILETYGTHSGVKAMDDEHSVDAKFAVVYSNSPILLSCDLLDFPGLSLFSTKEEMKFLTAINIVNHFVFLSRATSFLNSTDNPFLNKLISLVAKDINLEEDESPLTRLVIVASQAHHLKDSPSIDLCLDNGSEQLWKQLPDALKTKDSGINITLNQLRSKCVPFSSNDKSLQNQFEEVLSQMLLGHSIPSLLSWSSGFIKGYKESAYESLKEEILLFQSMKDDSDFINSELGQRISNWHSIENEAIKFRKMLQTHASGYSKLVQEAFSSWWGKTINKRYILNLIEHNGYSRKESGDLLGHTISAEIINKLRAFQNPAISEYNKEYFMFLQNYGLADEDIKVLSTAGALPLPTVSRLFELLRIIEESQKFQTWDNTISSAHWYSSKDQDYSLFAMIDLTFENPAGSVINYSWQERLADIAMQFLDKEQVLDQYTSIITRSWEQTANVLELLEKELLSEVRIRFNLLTDAATQFDDDKLANIIADLTRMREIINNIVW